MPYLELFWCWYTSLGSQTQTPKCSKVLISGVTFHQCSLLQSQESDVLSYSEHKIAKNFQGFPPGLHWEGLTVLSQTPQLHSGTQKNLLDMALQNDHFLLIIWHCQVRFASILTPHYFTLSVGYSLFYHIVFTFKSPSNFFCLDWKITISVFFNIEWNFICI